MYGRWKICTYAYHICLYMCALYIYAYIYVNTYRHISNNMISWCVQTWNSPKYSDFDEKNISFQTKIQGFFPTAESMADVVYSSNIYQISLSSLVPCFFSPFVWDLYDWCGFILVHMDFASQNQLLQRLKHAHVPPSDSATALLYGLGKYRWATGSTSTSQHDHIWS